jgi:hypothetical protein
VTRMKLSRLQSIVSSPWFTWIAGAAGILAFLILKLLPLPSWLVPDEILKTPTPVFLSIAAVLALWLLKLIILDARSLMRRAPRDFLYKKIVYRWHYSKDGSVRGNCVFDAENRSRCEVDRLPTEGLIWYNEITTKTVRFRIIVRESERPHLFEDDEPIISKIDRIIDIMRNRSGFHLKWSPKIVPPLAPGETIAYEVEISTPRTERDAFKASGTTVGFPVSRFTDRVELDAFAPADFRFIRLTPDVTDSDIEDGRATTQSPGSLPKPRISEDGSHVEWSADYPAVGRRYYFHYRFESKDAASTKES